MNSKTIRMARAQRRGLAVMAGLAVGLGAVAQGAMVSNVLINTYSSNYTLSSDNRLALGSINGSATRDSVLTSPDNWMTQSGTTGDITWYLNGRYRLDTIDVYNYREAVIPQARGSSNIVVSVSSDYGRSYTSLGTFIANKASLPVIGPNAPTTFNLGGVQATNVRFTIGGNYGDSGFVGLNEVEFFGAPTELFHRIPLSVAAVSTQFGGREGSKAVDGVYDTVDPTKMWLSAFSDNSGKPTITFSVGASPVALDHLNIWNYNESTTQNRGLNDIQIQFFDASMVSLGFAVDDADGDTTFNLIDAKGQLTSTMEAIEFRDAPKASFFKIITLTNPNQDSGLGGLTEVQAFAIIPEPSTMLLLGLGGWLLFRYRVGESGQGRRARN